MRASCPSSVIIIATRATYPRTYYYSSVHIIYVYIKCVHIIIIYCVRRKWMKIPPPVVKIVVSVRSRAGVIYDRGSRVLVDQWAKPWGPESLAHTTYMLKLIQVCVCVCIYIMYRKGSACVIITSVRNKENHPDDISRRQTGIIVLLYEL